MSPRIKYEPIVTTKMTTTINSTSEATLTTSTTTIAEETTINMSKKPIDITTKAFAHANEMIMSSELPSLTIKTEESNQTNQDHSSTTFISIPSTMSYLEDRPITPKELEMISTESINDYMTTNRANNDEEQSSFTPMSTTSDEEESSTVSIINKQYRLLSLLTNLSQHVTQENLINDKVTETLNLTNMENNLTTIKPTGK